MKHTLLVAAFLLLLATTGCYDNEPAAAAVDASASPEMIVDIVNAKGVKVGTAKLKQVVDGVSMDVQASHMKPGKHGIHFHEIGKCDIPDFKTAGEHFNPTAKQHGFDNPSGYHAGDLPNLVVGPDGEAKAEFFDPNVTLEKGKPNSLLKEGGTALIIHEKEDDLKTDPSGNSGNRIGCAAIR